MPVTYKMQQCELIKIRYCTECSIRVADCSIKVFQS